MVNLDDLPRKSGVYKFLDTLNGNFYIGSSRNIRKRFQERISGFQHGKGSRKLRSAWDDHKEYFTVEILEICDERHIRVREQFYIDTLQPFYNSQYVVQEDYGIMKRKDVREKISSGLRNVFSKSDFQAMASRMHTKTKETGILQSEKYREGQKLRTEEFWKRDDYRKKVLSSKHGNYKLSGDDVVRIRTLYKEHSLTMKELSELYKVSANAIQAIISRRNWKNLP